MAIISISKGSYSKGEEIAVKLAEELSYECVSRDILLEASNRFNIPEIKLERALHDSPSILERFTHGKEKYIAFISEAFLSHIRKDNIIYHGLAGQFFVRDVPNVMKVRIISTVEDRIKEEMKQENISETKARHLIKKDDHERRKWSMHLYGIDAYDSSLYDIVLRLDNIRVDDAVGILFDASRRPCFRTTEQTFIILDNLLLASRARLAIIEEFPTASVIAKNGVVYISVEATLFHEKEVNTQLAELLKEVRGVEDIIVNIIPIITYD